MNDWSKDINLETIKEYLQECAENDDYHYEQYQVDIVIHEYIRQKQVIEAITSENVKLRIENKRLNNILNRFEETLEIRIKLGDENIDMLLAYKRVLELVKELRGDSK